jgi:glycolate oxidase
MTYRYDALLFGSQPLSVALPETREEVQAIARWARAEGIPLIPRGAGSGLSGGAVPEREGLVLALTRMTQLAIDPKARRATVEPGVVTQRLQEAARRYGLFYPPDPASSQTSTLGGNLAENAGGPLCFRYGVTGDYVEHLEVVTLEGEVLQLGREAYDLAGLFIGSEGTLGIITRATLRLEELPPPPLTLRVSFPSVLEAAQATSQAIAQGLAPIRLEFMDQACLEAVERYLHLGLPPAGALLLIDLAAQPKEIAEEEAEALVQICRERGEVIHIAQSPEEAAELWKARRSISPALGQIRPKRLNEDIVVPPSELPAVVQAIAELGERSGLPIVQFGHIGDGNLHPNILYDPSREDPKEVEALAHAIARLALQHRGVLSGEHGIGLSKRAFLSEALDSQTLSAFRAIKAYWDPRGLLNPGKILIPEPNKM